MRGLIVLSLISVMMCRAGTHDLSGEWIPHEYLPAPFISDYVATTTPA